MSIWDPKQTLDAVGLGRQEKKRSRRVADAIRMELAVLLLQTARDPKLAEVAVSRVEVTDDLKIARIYYTLGHDRENRGGARHIAAVERSLVKAKGFMRTHIARTLNLRYTPDLQFRYDDTVEKVAQVESIFQEIENERKSRGEGENP
ncbi:MAG: 30S ribosome-binding factor RbfA [Desulfopila sp.]